MSYRNKLDLFNSFNNEYEGDIIKLTKGKRNNILKNAKTVQNGQSKEKYSFSSIVYDNNYNNDDSIIEKYCIMEKKCPFYNSYINIKNKMNVLLFSIKKIKKLNETLFNSLSRQTKLYKNLINENEILKDKLNNVSKRKYLKKKNHYFL